MIGNGWGCQEMGGGAIMTCIVLAFVEVLCSLETFYMEPDDLGCMSAGLLTAGMHS